MIRVRKKPIEVEAIRISKENREEISKMSEVYVTDTIDYTVIIQTLEGTMTGNKGDWIIKGVNGELYPCKDSIFKRTYEIVDMEGEE